MPLYPFLPPVKLVLDASAVLSGMPLPPDGELLLPPLVEKELGHAWARRKLEYLKEVRLAVREPSRAAIEAIRAKCRSTGDDARLSAAARGTCSPIVKPKRERKRKGAA